MIKMLIKLTKKEIKGKTKRDFKEGTIIKTGKYFIHIKGLKTFVNSEEQIASMKIRLLPQYIKDFTIMG